MKKTAKPQKLQFNMHGFLIEFDKKHLSWSWTKWDYVPSYDGGTRVVRLRGGLEFMKIFPTLIEGNKQAMPVVRTTEEMDMVLKKHGVDFIFLYQGETRDEPGFCTVEEAQAFYGVTECPVWDLTPYWFSYHRGMNSWCMFDSFTGKLEFTPATASRRLGTIATQKFPAPHVTQRRGEWLN